MTPTMLRRIVSARVYSTVSVPLSLEYKLAAPVAIKLTLGLCAHRRSWHVARDVIAAGLLGGDEVTDHVDGDVLIHPLPGSDQLLVGLRARPAFWSLSVAAADLERFLTDTYDACPPWRERRLVAAELDLQCGFFYLTQETQGGHPA